jgi:hypothetical protein
MVLGKDEGGVYGTYMFGTGMVGNEMLSLPL